MDAQIKATWLAALRSGEYEQGQKQLRRANTYCCLGVLCDVMGGGTWISCRDEDFRYLVDNFAALVFPPGRLRALAGLSVDDEHAVADLNDDGKSFAVIADYIEKHF